jgi:hypothetical protein
LDYSNLPARKKWILLYSLRSYSQLRERVLLNTVKKDNEVLYDLAYDSLSEYIHNTNKKLFRDEQENIYYFKTNSKSTSIELPFEFTGKLKKALSKLLVKPGSKQNSNIIKLKGCVKKSIKKIKTKV